MTQLNYSRGKIYGKNGGVINIVGRRLELENIPLSEAVICDKVTFIFKEIKQNECRN